MPQNLIEKIVQKYIVDSNAEAHSGDFVTVEPEHIMTHDNTGAVIPKFKSIGAAAIAKPGQPVYTLDHNVQDKSEANLKKYKNIEDFATEHGVDFYPAGTGIGHQIMVEQGYAFPGTMVVASDSHSNMYGGIGALGTPIVRTDAAAIWATGKTWWQIPPVAKIILKGNLPEGCSGKDVILTLCGIYNNDEVLNHALEFTGEAVADLSIEQRLSIANMTTEWGALAGVFPIDSRLTEWLGMRINKVNSTPLANVPSNRQQAIHPRLNSTRFKSLMETTPMADADAYYAKSLELDLSLVKPSYTGPHNVKSLHHAGKDKIKINKAYLLSCVNGRTEDLSEAAAVLKNKKIADSVKFYVAPASKEVLEESKKRGDWDIILKAGAIELPPGCGPCIGLGQGLLEDGEVGISATNRNFKGRMGSKNAEAYLASPATVADSAIKGYISPADLNSDTAEALPKVQIHPKAPVESKETPILTGFPKNISGRLLYCHADNMNTDGIYPGKYTYIDDFTADQQASVVMENYDPEFVKIAQKGDILAGGSNFGSGSSREQAATAFKYKGITCVIAASFSETYKRNAINNGFLVLEIPELIKELKKIFGDQTLTHLSEKSISINFSESVASYAGKNYPFSPVGASAQELVIAGNLENKIKKEIS